MRTIGNFQFPETKEEASEWEGNHEYFTYLALHTNVLVVAKTRIEGKWAAYIFPVPGYSHRSEWILWKTEGNKIEEHIARPMFPQFEGVPYDFP